MPYLLLPKKEGEIDRSIFIHTTTESHRIQINLFIILMLFRYIILNPGNQH